MDAPRRNWRSVLTTNGRRRTVNRIYGILIGVRPWADEAEVRRISMLYEAAFYAHATSQLDYEQKVAVEIRKFLRTTPPGPPPPQAPLTPPCSPGRRCLYDDQSEEED